MKNNKVYEIIKFIMDKIGISFYTHQCPVCNKSVRYNSKQFIETEDKVKCIHCQRYLEPIKISRKR